LIQPLICEAILIGLTGAGLAVVVTFLTFDALLRHVPPVAYRSAPVGVNLRVVIFALVLGVVGGLAFAVLPAWRASRLEVQALMQRRHQRGGGRRGRFGSPMIAVQVGLALVLVFGTVVAGRAFMSVLRVPLRFTPENVITISVTPRDASGRPRQAFYVRVMEAIARRGDVLAVGAAGSIPLDGSLPDDGVYLPGGRMMPAGIVHVLPGYFETVGIRLARGRLPDWDDVAGGSDVFVVSESAARVLFPGRDPIGGVLAGSSGRQFTIVGIVSDVVKSLDRKSESPVYVIPGDATRRLTVIARMRSHDDAALAEIKREVSALTPTTPVTAAWWADDISALTAYRNPRFQTIVLGSFAGLAIGLVAVGMFGVVSFLVTIRRREMGIRLAIGATPRSLVGLMVRQTLVPVFAGLVVGLAATPWLARLAEAQLFAVETRDPVTLAAAVVTVVAAALVGAYLPARRASRVDPVAVLRSE
jgi:predicted permease